VIFSVRLGDLESTVESDEDMTPEQSEDYLGRCSRVVVRMYAALPDPTPTAPDGE